MAEQPDATEEREFTGGTSKLFHIPESELADMEKIIPGLCMEFMQHLTPRTRTQFERLKRILSDVRWEGGPPRNVERIDA